MIDETTGSWHVMKVDSDYEIYSEYPYPIRRIGSDNPISESIGGFNGYVICYLNGKQYRKHRLIAIQFIDNPDDLETIDHINHIRTDNRIENLRWCSIKENCNNKSKYRDRMIQYVDELPEEAITVDSYSKWSFEDLYYHDGLFYFDNGLNYRVIPPFLCRNSYKVTARDVDDNRHAIYLTKFKKEYFLN